MGYSSNAFFKKKDELFYLGRQDDDAIEGPVTFAVWFVTVASRLAFAEFVGFNRIWLHDN